MEDNSNVIIKCLGKALKSSIKYVAAAGVKFFEKFNKDITQKVISEDNNKSNKYISQTSANLFICLGKKLIFFIKNDMKVIHLTISYRNIISYEYDKKNSDILILHISPSREMKNQNIIKIVINSKNRTVFRNNILCYYTIFYEYYDVVIKHLS